MSTPPTSDAWLRRVHALLAKAESTEFPAEAETLLAKAQELMARHAIDEAMLHEAPSADRDQIITTVVEVQTPYAGPKSSLLSRVADANRCRVVIKGGGRGARSCVVVGHRSDVETVKTMFSALSLHAQRPSITNVVMRCAAHPRHKLIVTLSSNVELKELDFFAGRYEI